MKKILSALSFILLSLALAAQNVHIAAQWGYWKSPEAGGAQNSLASLKSARDHNFWGSEFDVQLTLDEVAIVNHDDEIEGKKICDHKWNELRKIRLSSGELRPSLDDYLKLGESCTDMMLVMELRPQHSDKKDEKLVEKAVESLKKHNLFSPDRVMFISFSYRICEVIAQKYPEFSNQYLEGDRTPSELNAAGINGFGYKYDVLSRHPEWVAQAHKLGMSTNVRTVNKEEDMKFFIDLGIDCITTDEPLLLRKLLSSTGTYSVEACDLNLIGKICPETPKIYNRVDTVAYTGFNRTENKRARMSAGIAVLFKTNAPKIQVATVYESMGNPGNATLLTYSGYDLYIKKDNKWVWAGIGVPSRKANKEPATIVTSMDGSMHECMMYLPLFSILDTVKVIIPKGYEIAPLESPFRHRVAFFGSSFTHGASTSRGGMAYPSIFTRNTGIQALNLGISGNCKLQQSFARVIADADIDALVCDAFSNPSISEIEERLFPFIETVQAAHPGMPIIFQRTIYREYRNFNTYKDKEEQARIDRTEELMKEAMKRYKDVYYIYPEASCKELYTTVDGTHPGDYGYYLWERSIEKPLLRILRKYGIK
ncbi:MAG: hypothetical protein IKR69_03830 [Bacteroidales bacterium]|nr:hypothetical protein [Bacteroidales bacterium]